MGEHVVSTGGTVFTLLKNGWRSIVHKMKSAKTYKKKSSGRGVGTRNADLGRYRCSAAHCDGVGILGLVALSKPRASTGTCGKLRRYRFSSVVGHCRNRAVVSDRNVRKRTTAPSVVGNCRSRWSSSVVGKASKPRCVGRQDERAEKNYRTWEKWGSVSGAAGGLSCMHDIWGRSRSCPWLA